MFSNVYATEIAGPPRPKILTVTPTPTVKPTQTPISTPEPVPTQKPTSTPIPDTAEKDVSDPADQGTLSRPDHPDTISADKLVFIGDSRTEGLRDAVRDDSVWSCLSSMGYDWMVSTGVPQVEDQIEDNTAVIILMGVNDLYHVNDYISYINSKAAEWGNRGAQTYFVSVGPVQNDPYCTNGEIESFNADSRTEGLRDAVRDDSVWSCLSSMGYDWMVSTGVPQVEDQIEDNTAVIILMGVNDLYHVNDYISYINSKAAEWGNRGAQTYFVSVGPVQNDPYCTNGEIESFNAAMQANLSGATYIDVYSHLVSEGFSTVDGIHYPDSVSIDIYNYILDHLEEQRSGIWG